MKRERERKWGRKWETAKKKFKRLFDCISFHFVSDFIFLVALNIVCVCVCVRVVVHRICYDISVRRDDDYCFHRQQTYKTFAKFFAVGWAHNNGTKLYFSITFLRECASIAIEIEMKTRLPYPWLKRNVWNCAKMQRIICRCSNIYLLLKFSQF